MYESGSEVCKRCIKEKYKCRPATVAEIAKAEARCPQCKRRGLTNCWYEEGKTSCEPCIKWNKRCGAPTRRIFNAHTRSFLGIPTPEPEQHIASIPDQQLADDREHGGSANEVSHHAPFPLENEAKQASITTEQTTSIAGQELRHDDSKRQSRTSTRLSRTVTTQDGRGNNTMTPELGAALISSTLVRSSRRISMRNRASPLPLMVQEATPDDSAAEEAESLSAYLDMANDGSADLQLIMENNNAAPPTPTPLVNEPEVQDDDTVHVATLDNDSSGDEVLSSQQRRATVADQQALRPRRSRGRPSYVEFAPSDASDQEHEDDDVWELPDAKAGSEVDEDEEDFGPALESSSDEDGDNEDLESVDIKPEPVSASRRKSQPNSAPKQGKGLDLNLPPLNNMHDIAADMATKALELGFSEVLKKLAGRPINVATMCSGTESPLLFLQLFSGALAAKGQPLLEINHCFSAEIDTTKQAYIERNFHPRVLFRDVRQLGDETFSTATTAYGAEEEIPGNMDLLVVGFVCKDLSSLNSKKKTVDDQGETGDTWRAVYYYAKRFLPSIVLLENVKSDKGVWNDVVARWSKIGYEAAWVYRDTKNHYLPQTRERMYMIAVNRTLFGKGVGEAVAQWRLTIEKLQRQCSSPYEAFLVDLPVAPVDYSTLASEPDWSLCKLRYDQIRSEERLGTRRPVTQWSENGTLQ